MNSELNDLRTQVDVAEHVLNLLTEIGAGAETVQAQMTRCRELRRRMNALIPDSTTYDPQSGNIVAKIGGYDPDLELLEVKRLRDMRVLT